MNSELLQQLKEGIAKGEITKSEVMHLFSDTEPHSRWSVSNVLYYLGAFIVIIGISILIGQNWDKLSSVARILVTLGVSIATQVVAILLARQAQMKRVSDAFYVISSALLPLGLGVTLHEFDFSVSENSVQTTMAVISFAVVMGLALMFKHSILGFFAVVFGTWLFFSGTSTLVKGSPYFANAHFNEYRVLLMGIVYMLLGYSSAVSWLTRIRGFLYFVGSTAFLSATISLGGWKPEQDLFWELVFPLLAFAIMYLGVHLKRNSLLVISGLFIMGYILKLTFEYFTDSLGWPLALVIAGLSLIGVGYGMVVMNKKYIRNV